MSGVNGYLVPPVPAPRLDIPESTTTVNVKVIDSTVKLDMPIAAFAKPDIKGYERLKMLDYSFLIEHSSGRKILYDLGVRKDLEKLPPAVQHLLEHHDIQTQVEKNISEILEENGYDVSGGAIEAVIWSHWHFDHIGDITTFPTSTNLVVGPGFKKAHMPGYPINPDGMICDADYRDREVVEMTFDQATSVHVGGCEAFDYFGDGSFYILNGPGHAVGHVCGLARVTAGGPGEDTFIFLGGDACHHGGEFRPTQYLPLPENIDTSTIPLWSKGICPGAAFQKVNHKGSACEPFYQLKAGIPYNLEDANQTISNLQKFDASPNCFVIIAHDLTLRGVIDYFPKSVNGWKAKELAVKGRWGFLMDFEIAAENLAKQH